MPAYLKEDREADRLYVVLGGMKGSEFGEALTRVKAMPGRKWNPNEKRWEFERDAQTALRLMNSLSPSCDVGVKQLIKDAARQVAEQLLTRYPADAELHLPWADRLFPYQRAGIDAMVTREHFLNADEMGTGKTVQTIGSIAEYRLRNPNAKPAPTLTIAPKVLRGTWRKEFETWAPCDLQIVDARKPEKRVEQIQRGAEAVIINWEAIWRQPVYDALRKGNWGAIVADEAHRAKNRKAKQTRALFGLHAPLQFALTGTPVMNTPDELWSLLRWLYPKEYSSFWAFHSNYVDEYIGGHNERVMIGVKNPDKLRFELSDKMIRRRKKDVLDLPDKMEPQIIEVPLSPAEQRLYDEVEGALFLDIEKWIVAEATARFNDGRAATVEDETRTLMDEIEHMPLEKLVGLVENAGSRIAKLRQITAGAKVAAAEELIRDERETPVVAFTWHVAAAHALAETLSKGPQGMKVGVIAGTSDPDPVKDAFQEGELEHVVCTIAKGGAGLTLTRSSNPLFIEEDWVPSINDQAIDRTHRIGQHDPVTPRVLRCPDTVDTGKVAPKLDFKRGIVGQVLGE